MLATLGLVFSALFVMPVAAIAAPNNPAIVVGDIVITSVGGGQATIGDTLTVTGNWDASAADPHEGDTFTIGLPHELGFAAAVPFNLVGGDSTVWAECLTDPITDIATCTLTAAVVANPELVKGTFEFEVKAEVATTAEAVVFNLNEVLVSVPLPGGGGIDDGVVLPTEWTKTGKLNANKWSMKWTINLPGSALVGEAAVTIFEDLSANHQLCDQSNLKVETVRGSTVVDVSVITDIKTVAAASHDFSIVLTAPAGGFDPSVTYRITYDTCTPDGKIDTAGTIYTNEATVDIEGFGSSGIIGVTQDWAFTGDISKQGSVLGGTNRNGVIQWTVTVAGDHLKNKDSFTLNETLSGEHEICSDTISGIRVFERYGPSTAQQREVTADLVVTTVSSSTGAFEVKFSIAVGSTFVFQPSDYLYLIQYQTCATTDGLPVAGTVFGNNASVDGSSAGSTAAVPGRTQSKSGRINTAPVELDGVSYLPQTTLGWTITVPGEKLSLVGSELTVTDVLTTSHQVCGDEDNADIAARLGLSVEARDQISSGGLATVDLTSSVVASLTGNTITFTIPPPVLPLPGSGSETGFSHEYQYVFKYTTCTTTGGMDAPGTEYGNNADVAGIKFTQTVTQSNRGSGTGEGVTRGSIAVAKNLADTVGAQFVPGGTLFTVHVKEIDPGGTVQVEYDLQVPLNGAAVSGPNARGNGWTVELSEPTFPTVPGVAFGAPVFAETAGVTVGADGTTATVALIPGANIAVSLTNTVELGSLELVKRLTGTGAASVPSTTVFPVTASWIDLLGNPQTQDLEVTTGTPAVIENLPLGGTVHLVEHKANLPHNLRWAGVEWATDDENVTVVVDEESSEANITVPGEPGLAESISLTNEIELLPTMASTGVNFGPLQLGGVVGVGLFLLIGGTVLRYYRPRRS